jgi:dCTP deaminase
MESGFLTDDDIIKEHYKLFANGSFEKNNALRASYDLRLGEEAYITGQDYPQILSENNPFVTIPRGQFALLMTKEYITLPNDYLGLISIKFGIKAQGIINVSGFHVDPGFNGKILFSVFNAGPMDIVLKYGDPIFMIFFYKLKDKVGKPYDGDRNKQKVLPVRLVTSLKGTSASLSNVDKRVSRLETTNKVQWALIIALIGALIALVLRGALSG